MKQLQFEYKITIAYIIIGGIWIAFSDMVISSIITDVDLLTEIQTYKGWFYVIVTAVLFYFFIKNHLSKLRDTEAELKNHKNNLVLLIQEKTNDLELLNTQLKVTNEELNNKNEIIVGQNQELQHTLNTLKETQAHLIQSEKMVSLGTLTAGIAHEINNPLNYIMGSYVGLDAYFKEYGSMNTEKTDVCMQSIHVGIEKASAIIKGLNLLSRNSETFDETCNLHFILDNSLLILSNNIKSSITIEKLYTQENVVVKGNVGKLHQVFINILNNAIYAIAEKGTITITTAITKGNVEIVVRDTGCGIGKEELSQITNPFYTTKPPGDGTGLGLSITYSIIKEHNGTISFVSEVGKGTIVTITIPVHS
ncbi:MAG: Sensor protein ZraS [Bacteroidetes bacterium ADurb.Bin217]|nr:MAG: Sensor protein ZraS [Bacteroidetes bacterium ADurb.Bin217]